MLTFSAVGYKAILASWILIHFLLQVSFSTLSCAANPKYCYWHPENLIVSGCLSLPHFHKRQKWRSHSKQSLHSLTEATLLPRSQFPLSESRDTASNILNWLEFGGLLKIGHLNISLLHLLAFTFEPWNLSLTLDEALPLPAAVSNSVSWVSAGAGKIISEHITCGQGGLSLGMDAFRLLMTSFAKVSSGEFIESSSFKFHFGSKCFSNKSKEQNEADLSDFDYFNFVLQEQDTPPFCVFLGLQTPGVPVGTTSLVFWRARDFLMWAFGICVLLPLTAGWNEQRFP